MLINSQKAHVLVLAGSAALLLAGCRQDMHDQPKFKPLGGTAFYADKRESRPLLANTVSRGDLHDGDPEFYTGKTGKTVKNVAEDVDVFPIAVTQEFIERGEQRFNVFCSPCHGRLGNGLGMIVRRGFKQPPSYHIDRLRTAPVGHFYDVITNGYGAMYNYSAQITPRDRWAIIAYVRTLQYSQNVKVGDLSAEAKAKLPPLTGAAPAAPGEKTPAGSKPGAMKE